MSDMTITSSSGSYDIEIAVGAAARAVADGTVIVADRIFADRWDVDPARLVVIEAAESEKTLSTCERVIVAMRELGLRRDGRVVAVGGGVVQDIATLASSLYMRGVRWTYVPTTLMAMADSCIGGKSSINAGGMKNLVGNFYPPSRIAVDPSFVASLTGDALVSGLAEAVKICFARGAVEFDAYITSSAAHAPGPDPATAELIDLVLRSKKWFVEIDEFDVAERRLLNFGHSFGHAWESACDYAAPHGIAVAVGMMAAIRHPGSGSTEDTRRLDEYCRSILRSSVPTLDAARSRTDWGSFTAALRSDKKNSAGVLRLVLPSVDGRLELREFADDDHSLDVAEAAIRLALEDALNA
ncbi:MAG: 3-dehydroquinate synthase [Gordonia polyisoprenivorans]|nr:3-dehydroquinate synthase [Gordonia polyisoprenivorans]